MAEIKNKFQFLLSILNGGSRDFIKLIAAVLMVLDHMAFAGMVPPSFHNIIGRGVYPVFAYSLGCFLATNPLSIRKYMLKMLLFAIITQPIYAFFMGRINPEIHMLNVLFTLLLALLLGRLLMAKAVHPVLLHTALLFLVLGGNLALPIEYGLAGLIMPLLFAFVLQGRTWGWAYLLMCFLMLNAPEYQLDSLTWYTSSILSMICAIISFYGAYRLSPFLADDFGLQKRFLNHHFLYLFYPLHILVLALLK